MRSPLVFLFAVACAVTVACLIAPIPAAAQVTRISTGSGWWEDPSTWAPPGVPTLNDDVIIDESHTIHVCLPAAARSVVNRGVIDHPQGHMTADRRVTVLLMVGAVDSLVNYGMICGYNAPGALTDRNEIVPTSVLLTVTGDPFEPAPLGRIVNRGLVRAGDGYRRGQTLVAGGGVIVRGRPRVWRSMPGAVNVSNPVVRCENHGTITGGSGIGSGGVSVGGSVVIGLSPTGRDVDAPYIPFSYIGNPGIIESGGGGEVGGNVFLMAADALGLQQMSGVGGVISGDGGEIFGGGLATTSFVTTCIADDISFSGAGTHVQGAHSTGFYGWDSWNWSAIDVAFVDLDEGAIHSTASPNEPLASAGSTFESIAMWTHMLGNPAGTAVLVADPGGAIPPAIRVLTANLTLDPGVTLPDITDPPSEPVFLTRFGTEPAGAREDEIDPFVMLWPAGTPPDTTLRTPGHGLGSPGDTVGMWYRVWGNRRLHGTVEVAATDSLGFPILYGLQTVDQESVSVRVIEFDVVIPPWAEIGSVNPIYVQATYVDTPPVMFELRDLLHVVPTINLIAECADDGFFGPGSDPFDGRIDCSVRNEGRTPGSFHVDVWDSEGWNIQPSFTDCWLAPRSDTTLYVDFEIPEWAEPGDVDTVWFGGYDPISAAKRDAANRDEVYVEVPVDAYTSVDGVPAIDAVALTQNTPNPFNPRTEIRFTLPSAGPVDLAVYDVAGRLVRTLVPRRELRAGPHTRSWDGTDESGRRVGSGVYFCLLRASGVSVERKMVLLK